MLTANLESRHLEVVRRVEGPDKTAKKKTIVPLHDVDRVIIAGRPVVTIPVLQRFMKMGVPVFFTTHYGRWIGSLAPDNNMNAARRIRQYQKAQDPEFALMVACGLVAAKINNSRRVLQRLAANRSQSGEPEQKAATIHLLELATYAADARDMDRLRGYEGHAAGVYFSRLSAFFPMELPFNGRNRRPPKDPANALLSWTYSIVMGEIDGCVRSHGLDACIGCLHEVSHGTPALSVDLLEPLRAPLCDLLVLNMVNHGMFTENDFTFDQEAGGVFLAEESHKKFFSAYENAMTRKFKMPKTKGHTDFRRIIDQQVCQFLKALEDEKPPVFFQMP